MKRVGAMKVNKVRMILMRNQLKRLHIPHAEQDFYWFARDRWNEAKRLRWNTLNDVPIKFLKIVEKFSKFLMSSSS